MNENSNISRAQIWERLEARGGFVNLAVKPGVTIRLYSDSELSKYIYLHDFEIEEQDFIWRYLQPGDTFVDVGANIGLFTVIAAAKVGEDGCVYAFEPAAKPRNRLLENIRLNGFANVQVLPMALSDRATTLPLIVPSDGCDAWSSFAAPIWGQKRIEERVTVVPLDTLSWAWESRTQMIKIDVEGWEVRVLEGARGLLSRPDAPLLQVEFTEEAARSAGSDCQALYRSLNDLGYGVYRYDPDARCLFPEPIKDHYPYENLYATKRLEADNARLNQ